MRSENKATMKLRRRNIALTVAYDGTNYHGFQWQNPPRIAVQNVLEERLEKIFGDKIELAAAGRTDAGVHAFGQVVNFFTDGRIAVEKIPLAASTVLPSDIVVREAREVDKNFSALHSATSKIYFYRILRGAASNPFVNRFAWHIWRPLEIKPMREALSLLVGEHDFSSFKAASNVFRNPVRKILSAELEQLGMRNEELGINSQNHSSFLIPNSSLTFGGDVLTIKIHATGFLYHMARNIVAAVVEVGRQRWSVDKFKKIFEACDRSLVPATAPPQGLCLQKVFYGSF